MESTQTAAKSDLNLEIAKSLWQETFQVEDIEVDANFFSLGGHSLLGMDICARVNKELGANIVLKDLIDNPVLRDFASILPIVRADESASAFEKSAIKEGELSLSQFQAWYQTQMKGDDISLHHLPNALFFKETLDVERLNSAYKSVLRSHPSLRTRFIEGPAQEVLPAGEVDFKLLVETAAKKDEAIKDMHALALKAFNIKDAPLFRAKLYKFENGECALFHCFHHIIFDGFSYEIFYRSLSEAYEKGQGLQEDAQFLEHVSWQKNFIAEESYKKALHEWTEKLKGAPELDLPTDYARPANFNGASSSYDFCFSEELSKKVEKYSNEMGVSSFNVLYAAYSKMLKDFTGQKDLVVGLPMLGRPGFNHHNTIGYYANVVAIRTNKLDSVKEYIKHVQNEVSWASEREHVPFEKVKSALNLKKDRSRAPLTQTIFSYQRPRSLSSLFGGKVDSELALGKDHVHTDLDAWLIHEESRIRGGFEYRKDLFKLETIITMYEYFQDVVEFICEGNEDFKSFLSESSLKRLNKVNGAHLPQRPVDLLEKIEQRVSEAPKSIAVSSHDGKMSYQELWSESSEIAQGLVDLGIRPGDLVGVAMERGTKLMPALVGVLRSGAGYVPVDPQYPQDRIEYMISQSDARIILADRSSLEKLGKHQTAAKLVDEVKADASEFRSVAIDQNSPAYVIYTSGSTGLPKGVRITRKGMSQFLNASQKSPGFSKTDTVLAVTTLSFDISVLELFLPLVSGGSAHIASKMDIIDGKALKTLINKHKVNFLQATPPTWRLLLGEGFSPKGDFKALCGGEAFPPDLAKKLVPICSEVWNMYGPTETTVWASLKKIERPDEKVLIGKPLEGYTLYTLDENRKPVPYGAVGEIFIGGECLATGYEGRDDLTQDRFVFDPLRGEGRMYMTGDLGRFHPSGDLECLGRNDDQVKVRGYRIELGEVESAMSKLECVQQAVAMAREDRPGDKRLVGYLKGTETKTMELRKMLRAYLPSYMIPSNFIWMDEFPQTLNGKVDKKELPPLELHIEETPIETFYTETPRMAEFKSMWRRVLAVPEVLFDDDFFDVGGNSLLSVELFAAIKKAFGVEIPLSFLAESSRFGDIWTKIDEATTAKEAAHISGAASSKTIPAFCHSLVPIKESGDKNPVFCFHGVGGNVLNYLGLAPVFSDRPVFGLQSRGLDRKSLPLSNLRKMAKAYTDEIRLIQPNGPYILLGGSMGGILAFESAKILKQAGERVERIIMIDSFGPALDFSGYHEKGKLAEKWDYISWLIKDKLYSLQESLLSGLGLSVPIKTKLFNIESHNWRALWTYDFSEYEGDIDLIRAPLSDKAWYSSPDMGWKKVTKGEVRPHYMDAGHDDFMEHPLLPQVVANVLRS